MTAPQILIVDTDTPHREAVVRMLKDALYEVETILHEEAVAHVSREDMARYGAIIVVVRDEPSTLSSDHRLGEYVLHYVRQLRPEVLARVIVVTPRILLTRTARGAHVLVEPVSAEEILGAVRAIAAD